MEKKTDSPLRITERHIEKEILFWLNQSPDIVAFKHETQGQYDPRKRIYRVRYHTHGVPALGAPDIVCFIALLGVPVSVFLEVKKKGGKQSPNQVGFEELTKSHGGYYFVVRSIEEVQTALNIVKSDVPLRLLRLEGGG